jgi:hypothetical protein
MSLVMGIIALPVIAWGAVSVFNFVVFQAAAHRAKADIER